MPLAPVRLVLSAVDQLRIVDLQQPQLFKIGIGEPPTLTQVHNQTILEYIAQGPSVGLLDIGLDTLGGDEVVGFQSQGPLGFVCEGFQAQLMLPLGVESSHEPGA